MALIKKNILVCNKCGKEAEASSNMTILGEEFYLCDKCLERLINWLTVKSEPVKEDKPNVQEEFSQLVNECFGEDEKKVSCQETKSTYVAPSGRPTTYIQWDEYNINKLLDLWGQNFTGKQCAAQFKTGWGSVAKILTRIRQATPGTTLYQYQSRLNRLDIMRKNPKKEGDN